MKTEVVVTDSYLKHQVIIHHEKSPNEIGRFAMALLEKWGMVAAVDDGEDSTGRHKLRLQSVEEIVDRAVSTAIKTYEIMNERGLLVDLPTWEEAREMARKERERN